jgi:class 3 adenylate cyclase
VSDTIETLQAEPTPPSRELADEAILTTHRILEAFGRDGRTFDIFHADLFSSRPVVALSALQAVTSIADPRSLVYVARLFRHPDPGVVCAAVRAAGAVGTAEALPLLLSLSASSREDSVQLEVLRALANGFPDAPETRQLAVTLSRSVALQEETRTACLEVLTQLPGSADTGGPLELAQQNPDVLPFLLQRARKDDDLAEKLFRTYRTTHAALPLTVRGALVSLAAPFSSEQGSAIFLESLQGENQGVRRECYRHLGAHPGQVNHFDALCGLLVANVENDPSMEEEALAAVNSMESGLRAADSVPLLPSLAGVPAAIEHQFDALRAALETDLDTAHEMGQQIASAKEYIEFHLSEEAKKAFLQSIKAGGSPQARRECAHALKDSAVRLESRHYDGYRILLSLLADPGRPGIALFIRNLTHADTGKRAILCGLKRSLALSRLAPPAVARDLFVAILEWAREMKLYRLAELALFALHRVDPRSALAVCREFMTPPVVTKILAIAAFDLMKDMDLAEMEPIIISLLYENDRYIRLALLESLDSVETAPGVNLLRSILQLFCAETDPEVSSQLVDLLGAKGDAGVARALIEVYDRFDDGKKTLAIPLLARIAQRAGAESRPALTEFLYRVLRADSTPVLARVPAALLALGDDYAPNVIRDLLPRLGPAERATLVRDLRDSLRPAVIAVVWSLLREPDRGLQQTLRETLPRTSDPRAQQLLVSMVRTLRTRGSETEPQKAEASGHAARLSTEKEAYRFEREHMRTCAVVFTDIEDYSGKAQEMSSMELSVLLQEYEGILLPIIDAHEGTLVKRMGDGHLFVFREALEAVLAAIRVQKALRRYNRFQPERQRVQIRIGIHWGEVVERAGDVLGNTVNIASRLQTVAMGGSTCISQDVYDRVADWIHANDLGALQIKGVREPIHAWEPTEAALGMPAELDPFKRSGRREPSPRSESREGGASRTGVEALSTALSQAFQRLQAISRRSARAGEETAIDQEFVRSWEALQPLLADLGRLDGQNRPSGEKKD